jgi:hypothetical protein
MGSIEIVFALLGSAAIGALISSIITVLSQRRERKSRREELALATATTMAANRTSTLIKIEGKIEPDIVMVEDYFTAFKHLMGHGRLDDKTEERVAAELKSHGLKR